MKITYSFVSLIAGASLLFNTGCKKEEAKPTVPPAPTAAESGKTPADAAKEAAAQPSTPATAAPATQATAAAATTAATAATNIAAATATAAATADTQVQSLIDKVKSFIADKKYQDALTTLQGLRNFKLTPEQQTLVDGLKTQIEKALAGQAAGNAASAVGDVLGGKK
jgi:hypothetical protein